MKAILGTLPRLSYFVHEGYIYRIIDLDKEFLCKGAKKITHIYVNPIMMKELQREIWHEVKNRDCEEMDIMTMVEPCSIGPIYPTNGEHKEK